MSVSKSGGLTYLGSTDIDQQWFYAAIGFSPQENIASRQIAVQYLFIVHMTDEFAEQVKPAVFGQAEEFDASLAQGSVDLAAGNCLRDEFAYVPGISNAWTLGSVKKSYGRGRANAASQHFTGIIPVASALAGPESVTQAFDAGNAIEFDRNGVVYPARVLDIPQSIAGIPQYSVFWQLQKGFWKQGGRRVKVV